MRQLRAGQLVRYLPQPSWGIGDLIELLEEERQAWASFPGREEPVLLPLRQDVLRPITLEVGAEVIDDDGEEGEVSAVLEVRDDLTYYRVRYFDGGHEEELREDRLHAALPPSDMLSLLAAGEGGSARAALLRRETLKLDAERKASAVSTLFASRVMPLPYQISVVDRVLRARVPRFVLADEVGLGKTIEAGMILSGLRLAGLARRVLVVSPSHLMVQWLAEMAHKFNLMFTVMDGDRYKRIKDGNPKKSPWVLHDRIITSLDLLARSPAHVKELSAKKARFDLVIIDEAHHLTGKGAFEAASALAKNCWGMLLLSATPMHLDPEAYHRMLSLLDPKTAPSMKVLKTRLARQLEVSQAVRRLQACKGLKELEASRTELQTLFPDDERVAELPSKGSLLDHLAAHYSVSTHLIRNRRAVVGGFTERHLERHRVKPGAQEKKARKAAIELLTGAGQMKGAVLSRALRGLESSSAALHAALAKKGLLSELEDLGLPEKDSKAVAFLKLMERLDVAEGKTKALVFTESRATLDFLIKLLADQGIRSLGYHGELAMLERDRRVARFRDDDGPQVLVSTEVGGEGRNFQFAHHLVCYDLPWSPSAMEQRIGRLDRVGQREPVSIHVLTVEDTLTDYVADLFENAIGVFQEPVGGLDTVLEEVEPAIAKLALATPKAQQAYLAKLTKTIRSARERQREAWDPLLDHRSNNLPRVQDIADRTVERFGAEDYLGDEPLVDKFWGVSRDLGERLEDCICQLGRQVGLGVDTEENVGAFEAAFDFGTRLKVDSLPGLSVTRERREVGTFWRDTAVDREEISYFTTGHPIVEALFAYLHDSDYGRVGWRQISARVKDARRGFSFLFEAKPSEPLDTSPGSLVPSRHLARFFDSWLIEVVVDWERDDHLSICEDLGERLESKGKTLRGAQLDQLCPNREAQVESAAELAIHEASIQLAARQRAAAQAIGEDAAAHVRQLSHALRFQGVSAKVIERRLRETADHYQALNEALAEVELDLDSAHGFVIVPR